MTCGGGGSLGNYKTTSVEDGDDQLANYSLKLGVNIEDCITMCDNREGCYAADLNTAIHSCVLYGFETTKVVVNADDALNIEIQHSGNQKREGDKGDKEITFETAVNINRIKITGKPKSLALYDINGKIQKQYDEQKLSIYKQSDEGVYVVDDVYA